MANIQIAAMNRTEWRILEVSSESGVCRWAAGELRRYLKQLSGADFPLAEAGETAPVLVIGLREHFSASDRALLPPSAEGHDGYALCVTDSRILLAGDNERGVVYAVYDLLERLGCRWFYPTQDAKDPEVVPHLDSLTLETGAAAVASPIPIRICNASSFFFDIDPPTMLAQLDNAMKSRYNGIGWQCDHRSDVGDQYRELVSTGVIDEIKRRGMLLHGPAHSFPHFLKNDDYFETHPEWFGVRDGKRMPQVYGGAQFCWSNAEARRRFVDNAEKFVLESPALDIFCTLGFDGGPSCACAECAKSTPGDLLFLLMNELIERLAKSAPHVRVETSGGYDPVHEPPQKTQADSRLRIVWAHWGRHHGMGFDDDRYGWKDNLETWRKAALGGLTLCLYYTDNFATPWVSAPYVTVLEGDRRYVLDKNVDAIYMLVYPKGYWWNHGLNNHMAGRCYYDASLAPRALVRDYALHYFGPKAGPLLADYYAEWAEEIELPYRVKDDSRESDRAMLARQRRDWLDPAIAATANDPVLSHRVGKVAKLHDAAERLTDAHRMRDEIIRLRVAGEFDQAEALLEEAKRHTDAVIAHLAALAELNEGLFDRNEVPGFMTLTIKGWIPAEEKAVSDRNRQAPHREAPEPDSMTTLPSELTE